MKFRVEGNVYELSIGNVLKRHEFYDDLNLALESAMDDIFESEVGEGMWLTKPLPLNLPIYNVYYWQVQVRSSKGIVKQHTIKIRRSALLSRA